MIAARGHPAEQHDPLAGVARAQRAAVVGSLEVGQKLGHAENVTRRRGCASAPGRIRVRRLRVSAPCRSAACPESPTFDEHMRLRVLYHGNCFDGCSSAGMFARFYRERIAKGPVEVVYRPAGAQGRRRSRSRRTLRRRRERLRRFSLLPGSAPDVVVRSPRLGVSARRRRGPLPRRRHRAQVLRPEAKSCTKFLADTRARASSASTPAPLAELIEWAEIIDGALFPSAQMAVELKEPALRLMTLIENNRDPKTGGSVHRGSGQPAARPTSPRIPYVAEPLKPLLDQHAAQHRDRSAPRRKLEGNVVFFDLADRETGRVQQVHLATTCSPRPATRSA